MNNTIKHPEQQPNENWVGNTTSVDVVPEDIRHLKTARIGRIAYNIEGKPISQAEYRPLFIGDADYEAYDRIKMAQFKAIRGWQ